MDKPGDIITPASFTVAPELLGKPLARPGRRATAMAIDLALVGLLNSAGAVFFGVAAAFAIWRASARTDFASRRPRLRQMLRIGAAVILFVVVASNWGFWTRPLHRLASTVTSEAKDGSASDADEDSGFVAADDRHGTKLNVADAAALGGGFFGLRHAKDEKEARRVADKLVNQMQKQGMRPEDVRQMAEALTTGKDGKEVALPPIGAAALEQAVNAAFPPDTSNTPPARVRDSLAAAYAAAMAKPDSDAARKLRPRVADAFAGQTIADLNAQLEKARIQNGNLKQKLDAARTQAKKGVGFVDTVADAGGEVVNLLRKAGLGFGWLGLYFTGFIAMMRGQTPGKRLMGIRVVRLDGRPMNWWASLERFGGYAASVVTALSGFFQILWDKNRQAMHDKIAETVVVRV